MPDSLADAHLTSLAGDREALRAIDPTTLDNPVPGCPDWDVTALLGHLGWVHRFAALCLAADPDDDLPLPDAHPPNHRALIAWVDDGMGALLAELDPPDLDRPCPSFLGPSTRRWWLRRQAFETAVHRWDAQSASGRTASIPNAADGIDEWLDLQPARGWVPPTDLTGTIHLHSTDGNGGAGEWFIELAGALRWEHAHRKGDVAVRGPASDLYLMLWGRLPASELDVVGDIALLDRFLGTP